MKNNLAIVPNVRSPPVTLPLPPQSIATNMDSFTKGVYVRNATKGFGVGRFRCSVLQGLDMSVKKGTIYGLLGASGCGKTTLLSCIVGRKGLDTGDILVLGGQPGSPESGIPGPRVGYMPQELALYGDFTIKETLQYFGRIYKLEADFVLSQMEFLINLLDLPDGSRFIHTLSGGQQRRVSFAVALFHEPELLILDEPTVGVDPLLRRSIWKHLISQSVEHGRTVIITTHYIEEARQADTIGMMRSGRLLAEDSPQNLLDNYRLSSLEDVFLRLCMKDANIQKAEETTINTNLKESFVRKQFPDVDDSDFIHGISQLEIPSMDECGQANNNEEHTGTLSSILPAQFPLSAYSMQNGFIREGEATSTSSTGNFDTVNIQTVNIDENAIEIAVCRETEVTDREANSARCSPRRTRADILPSPHRSLAIIRKNMTHTFRSIWMFIFVILLPVFQAVLFCSAIGRDPTSLNMAIVNDELDNQQGQVCNYTTDCAQSMLSCRYLQFIDRTMITQVPYKSLSDAMDATRNGQVWGVVHFGQNFTHELGARQSDGVTISKETITASQIAVTMDFSNQQIAMFLQHRLTSAFESFSSDILRACDYNPSSASMPVTFLDPVYGRKNSSSNEFMAPGIIMTIVYFMAVALTTGVFIVERKSGLLDRSLVAGVKMSEVLLAHLVNQFTVLLLQTALVFIYMLWIFKIPCEGNLALAVSLTLFQGLCGMSYGLLVSSLCDTEISAIQLSLGSFFPTLVLSGVVWPMEGMSIYLRYISYALPQTYAIEALRSVFARGWGIVLPEVYLGILISLAWICILLALSVIVVRIRKHTG